VVKLRFVVIILILVISFSAYRDLFGARQLLSSAIYPLQYAGLAIFRGLTGFPAYIFRLGNLSAQNEQLGKELEKNRAQLSILAELLQENERLRAQQAFLRRTPFNLLPAQVIGRAASSWMSVIVIGRGASAGIRVGQAAITADGLVGQVIEAAPLVSKVLLLTDPSFRISAADRRSRDSGVTFGRGSARLQMKYVLTDGDVKVGDMFVTAASSTIFPAGLPVGKVSAASRNDYDMFYQIELIPAADLSALEEVFVVL
jgi:rod shape-determining protein MreC